ncbi:hypothetical protein BGZ80_002721 [Entomortierella chlamydospora]|uniref:Uncharacterized protein n=1 Tax=Entomortierella chlamydospora TaxID=101097 RepID=A0A9P6SX30_9FUNG|nr:hypothetical protein BGZ80_002721 [Entomortierella chlamydospora]
MIKGFFSSTSSRLPLEDVLELANEHLDNAHNASTPAKALLLCDNAKTSIKDAENIINKRVKGQTLNDNIANAYQRHGKLLEGLGEHGKAQKSYSKAKKWGYTDVATLQIASSRLTNPSDFIRQSLCPPTSLLAASSITAAVYLGVSDVSNQTPISQGHTDGASLIEDEGQMRIITKDNVQVQQMIFGRDASLSITKFALPEFGGRITSTYQLAYCLSLLHHSLDSKRGLDKAELDWSQAIDNDPSDKERLETMATDVIRAFLRDEIKGSDAVAEVIGLAAVLKQDDFRKLLEVFVNGIGQSVLLKVHFLDGLAYLMKNAPQGSLDPDDLVRILELLSTQLKGTHQQSAQHTYLLATTISRVLDSMVDSQVEGLAREQLHEPLSQYLQELQKSTDPRLVYQAAYACQSLQHIPDDETFLKSMMRRTGKVVRGISGVVSAVKAVDLDRFINGLQHIQEGLSGVKDTISLVNDAYKDAKELVENGQGFLKSLKEGLSFSRKSAWYPALRGLDLLIQEARLTEFEKLIREAPCRQDPTFQWGACQRLGKMYEDDSQWSQQVPVKQWIVRILTMLSNFPEVDVTSTAKKQLQDLEAVGGSNVEPLHQLCIDDTKESCILTIAFPPPQSSRLLDIIQNKTDVEVPLRQLKHERLKEGGGDVYISPRAKHHVNAADSFDLTSEVQEFFGNQKKVFLLLGDSGSGKSTFNRVLEMDLWNKYGKDDERIPLLIHLPTIKEPEHGLIDKHLRDLNFTESQIRELKLHREFILICDGYDESQQTRNLYTSNRLNQVGQWRAQMVIACRTEYVGVDYKSCFQPTDRNNSGSSELFQEMIIAPFNKDQIHDYINQYVTLKEPSWKSIDYQQALRQIPNLQDLVRLRDMDLNPRDQEAFKMLSNSGFKQECIAYLKELSTAVYDHQGGNPFIIYSERRDQKTWKGTLFNNLDGRNLIRESIPLLHNGEQNRFVHKSVLEYGLSPAVFDPNSHCDDREVTTCLSRRGSTNSALSFESPTLIEKSVIAVDQHLLDSPFGRMNFVDDPSVSRFLVERVQQQPIFADQLHAMIERSKTEKTARTAAANAITVLVRAGVQFVGTDLRGIKTPGADLSYGMFDSAQLDGADLRKANLYNIWLRKATLCGAWMTSAKFGELPLLQESRLGHDDLVICAALSPSGGQITTGGCDETVGLWSVDTGACVCVLMGHHHTVTSIAYSLDGSQIASGGSDKTIRLWNVASGHCINTLYGHDAFVVSLMYSPDGRQIASGSVDQTVRLWDIRTGDCINTLQGHGSTVSGIVYSPSGDQVASGSWDCTVRLWKVEAGNLSRNLKGHTGSVFSVAKSPKGDQVASGSSDKTVRLWSAETNSCVHILEGHENAINVIDYSPNGDQIASGSDDNKVRLWDVKTGSCVYVLQGHDAIIRSVVFSPKGDQIASGSEDKTVRLWDVETGNCVQVLQGYGDISAVVYSPNEGQIAFGSENDTVLLCDVESGKCIYILEGHGESIAYVVYSPRGDQIASGDLDGELKLWNASTGNCVHTLHGHTRQITCITYSQSGDKLASGSYDNTVRLWDVETGQFLVAIAGFSGAVSGVVWQDTSEGQYVVTGSWDKSVRRWEITKEGDEYQVRLCWSSSNDGLVVAEANFKGVQGLSQENLALIRQRGASIGSSIFLE